MRMPYPHNYIFLIFFMRLHRDCKHIDNFSWKYLHVERKNLRFKHVINILYTRWFIQIEQLNIFLTVGFKHIVQTEKEFKKTQEIMFSAAIYHSKIKVIGHLNLICSDKMDRRLFVRKNNCFMLRSFKERKREKEIN